MPTKPVFTSISTKAFYQYILNLMSKKRLGSFNDLIINTYCQSFICLSRYRYGHFLASIFCKVFLALLSRIQPILEKLNEKIRKPWKNQSLTDLINGANIGTHSNSRKWLFWMFMMSKMNSLMNKSMLFSKRVTSSRNTILKYEHIAPHV